MKPRPNPALAHERISLRFERTRSGLTVFAVDARGLELLRPLARALEATDEVREVRLYCDRVLVELEARPSPGPLKAPA